MAEAAELYERFAKTCAQTYATRSGLDVAETRSMQDSTTWLCAAEAKDKGFCTDVIAPITISAVFTLPEAFTADIPAPLAKAFKQKGTPPPAKEKETPATENVNTMSDAEQICELCAIAGKPEMAVDFIRTKKDLATVRAELLAKVAPPQQTPATAQC